MANKKLTLSFEAIFVDRVSQGLAKLETDTLKVSKSVKSSLEAIQKGLLPTPTNNDQIAIAKLTEFKRLLDETKKSLENLNSIKLLGVGKVPKELQQQFSPDSSGRFNAAKADKERRDQIKATQEFATNLEKEFTALHAAQVKQRLADTLQEVAVQREIQENNKKRIAEENDIKQRIIAQKEALATYAVRQKELAAQEYNQAIKNLNTLRQSVIEARELDKQVRQTLLGFNAKKPLASLTNKEEYLKDFSEGLILHRNFLQQRQQQLEAALEKEILTRSKAALKAQQNEFYLGNIQKLATQYRPLSTLATKESAINDQNKLNAIGSKILQEEEKALQHNRAIWKDYITDRLNKEDLLRDKIIKRLEVVSRAESLKSLSEKPLSKLIEAESEAIHAADKLRIALELIQKLPPLTGQNLLKLLPGDADRTREGYKKFYLELYSAYKKFADDTEILAKQQAANLALPLESLSRRLGRVNSTIVPQGGSLSSGLTNPILPTPKINTEALANYQKQFARQEELAKNSATSLEGIALRRDIAIEQEEQRHAEKLLTSEKALADAIAKNWSISAQKQITDQAALASSQSAQRIALLQQNAAKELAVQQGNINKFNQNLQEQTERTRFNIAEQHALHVHGAESLQVAQIRANERQRQLAQDLQRSLADISRRQASGTLPLGAANAEVLHAQQEYQRNILQSTRALHAMEQQAAAVAERHRSIFLRVGEIISAYTIWNAIRNILFNALKSVPSVGMELETTKSVLATTMGGYSEATLVLKKLTDEADRTGIKLTALRETWRNFSASTSIAGESEETSWKIFKNMDTVITSLHLSADKATGIFNALAQIFNKAKVQSEELVKQLGNLLPGAFAAFAKANNFATQELVAKMKRGEVFAHDTIEKFAEFYAKRFEHSFDKASQSLNANVGRMQSAWILLGETIYGQTSGIMVSVVKTFTSVAQWIDEDIKGVNLLGNSFQVLATIEASSFVMFLARLPLVAAAFATVTRSVYATRASITFLAATSSTSFAAMQVGATLTGRVISSAFALLKSPTVILAGIGLIISKMLELRGEAKEFRDRIAEAAKYIQEPEVKGQGKEDVFKATLTNDPALQQYLADLKKVQDTEGRILIQRLNQGKTEPDTSEEALQRADRRIVLEKAVAKRTEEIRQTVDKDYIVSTKDHHAALQRMRIEALNNEGKTLEAAKLQYELTNKETLIDFEEKVAEEVRIREQANKKIAEFQKMGLATLSKSNEGDYALAQQQREDADKAIIEYLTGIEEYKFNLTSAGRVKETQADSQASASQLKIAKTKFEALLKQQKEYLQTSLTFYDDYIEELEYKQSNINTALTQEGFLADKRRALEEKRLELLTNMTTQVKYQVAYSKTLAEVEASNLSNTKKRGEYTVQEFIKATQKKESAGYRDRNGNVDPDAAVSSTAALGRYQLQPSTALDFEVKFPAKIEARLLALETKGKGISKGQPLDSAKVFSTEELTFLEKIAKEYKPIIDEGAIRKIVKDYVDANGQIKPFVDAYYGKADPKYIVPFTRHLNEAKGTSGGLESKLAIAEINNETEALTQVEDRKQALLDLDRELIKLNRESSNFQLQRLQKVSEFAIQELELKNKGHEVALARFDLENRNLIIEETRRVNTARILDLDGQGTEETQQAYEIRVKEAQKILEILGLERKRLDIQSSLEVLQRTQAANSDSYGIKRNLIDLAASRNQITSFRADLFKQTTAEQELQSSNFVQQIAAIRSRMGTETGSDLTKSQNEIDSLILRMKELEAESNKVGDVIKGQVVDNLTNSFIEFANGTKTATEALKSFGVNFLQMIEQIIVKEMALAAVEAGIKSIKMMMFSSGGSVGGGIVNGGNSINVSSAIPNKATGGILSSVARDNIVQLNNFRKVPPGKISGPGSDTSDSISTVLPDGSYILKASAARRIGYDRLQKLISEGSKRGVNRPGKLVNVSANEVNIPPEVVQKYGVGFFDNLNRADGGAVGHIDNLLQFQGKQATIASTQVNNINIHVSHTGKESSDELANKISTSVVQAIAQKEASKQIYLYDKNQKIANRRKV